MIPNEPCPNVYIKSEVHWIADTARGHTNFLKYFILFPWVEQHDCGLKKEVTFLFVNWIFVL